MAEAAGDEPFVLGIAAEGTRSRGEYWKSGFYRIAQQTGLPITLAFLDGPSRTVGWGPTFSPTGDVGADMDRIRAFYADKTGLQARRIHAAAVARRDRFLTASRSKCETTTISGLATGGTHVGDAGAGTREQGASAPERSGWSAASSSGSPRPRRRTASPPASATSSSSPNGDGIVGVKAPLIMVLAFIPMYFIAVAYSELNKAEPDCGTTFTWAARAFGTRTGWLGGWGIIAADVIVMANLAQIAGSYSFALFGVDTLAASTFWSTVAGIIWIVVMTYICYRGIEVSVRLQYALLGIEIVTLVAFALFALVEGVHRQRARPAIKPVARLALARRAEPDGDRVARR